MYKEKTSKILINVEGYDHLVVTRNAAGACNLKLIDFDSAFFRDDLNGVVNLEGFRHVDIGDRGIDVDRVLAETLGVIERFAQGYDAVGRVGDVLVGGNDDVAVFIARILEREFVRADIDRVESGDADA